MAKAEKAENKVHVRLPRARAGEEDTVFVGVNGRTWRIKKGEDVEVPECVAEVLQNSVYAEDRAAVFQANL